MLHNIGDMRRIALLLAVIASACAAPALSMSEGTPDDLVMLGESVFEDFVAAFPAHEGCIGTVELQPKWDLTDRARYYPDEGVIEVRVPATAPHLTASLVHELGHHLEYECAAQLEVRAAFLAALDFAPDTHWVDTASYEMSPSELWAEAVVRHVTGAPDTRRPLRVTEAAVDVVGRWAEGQLTHVSTTP